MFMGVSTMFRELYNTLRDVVIAGTAVLVIDGAGRLGCLS